MVNKDPNITVDGKPIDIYLEGEKEKILQNDVQQIIQEALKPAIYREAKKRLDSLRERSSRTRRLSLEQIRKEFGIMTKPFNTDIKNVLWVFLNKGAVSTGDISSQVGISKQRASETIIKLRKRIPDLFIKTPHETTPNLYNYALTESYKTFSVEILYDLYRGKKSTTTKKEEKKIINLENLALNVTGKIEIVFRWER